MFSINDRPSPSLNKKNVERPKTRYEDAIQRVAGLIWIEKAQDRRKWYNFGKERISIIENADYDNNVYPNQQFYDQMNFFSLISMFYSFLRIIMKCDNLQFPQIDTFKLLTKLIIRYIFGLTER